MAVTGTSFVKVERNCQGFTAALTSAACELLLILLLLADALLSYLLTKFASYCKLQAPCILCSRLDHLLGNEKPEFYRNLFCSNHRSEISSLIYCHIHDKLADGSGMCGDCLLAFTTKNKPNPEKHRLLVGMLGLDLGGYGFQSPLLNRDLNSVSTATRLCSCCNRPWRSRENAQRLLQLKSPGISVTRPYIQLPHLPSRSRLNRRDSLKKVRDKFSGSVSSCRVGKRGFNPLSHVGYTELKITSDSESEVPFSDDDGSSSMIGKKVKPKVDFAVQCGSEFPPKTLPSDLDSAKLIHPYNLRPSLLDAPVEPDFSKPHDVKSLASSVAIDHGLSELNWQQVSQKADPSALPELIILDDIPSSANVTEIPHAESMESTVKLPLYNNSSDTAVAELISLVDASPSVGASPENSDVTGTNGHVLVNKHEELLKLLNITAGASIKADQIVNAPPLIKLNHGDPIDVGKMAVSSEEREASGIVAEQTTVREPDTVNEDLKLLPSHNSSSQGINLSSNVTTPVVRDHGDEQQITDATSYNESQMLQKSASVESSLDFMDGNVSEIEGESFVDRLKRQVEYDKKCMNALYKELEEERNATAIATNQAMAMITRLQEEKATLHMEALQYLRMMEEQAEHDVDALEKANDLLAEKEKDVQDLEAELEFYRSNFPGELMVENIHEEISDLKGENVTEESAIVPCTTNDVHVPCNSSITEVSKSNDNLVVAKISSLEFEDERLYISQCLKSLERKLHQVSHNGSFSSMPNSGRSETFTDGRNDQEESLYNVTQSNGQMEINGFSMKTDLQVSNGSPTAHEGSTASDGDDRFVSKENDDFDFDGQKNSMRQREINLIALENEISDLNDRLKALESDHDFLEHSLNSLRNGNEGLKFIQEIARQLHELRKL